MSDLKMDAPPEIRGSFKPISTNVPGIEICEHMPRLAKMMDKVAIIRALYGCPDQHASDLCLSGYPIGPKGRQDNHPSLGSTVSRLHGPVGRSIFVLAACALVWNGLFTSSLAHDQDPGIVASVVRPAHPVLIRNQHGLMLRVMIVAVEVDREVLASVMVAAVRRYEAESPAPERPSSGGTAPG